MDPASIQQFVARYVEAFNRGDSASLAALFAQDAKLMPPYVPMVVGRKAIQRAVNDFKAKGLHDLSFRPVDVQEHGELVIEVGAYQVTVPSPDSHPVTDIGKDVRIWKREDDGTYKLLVDIWNSDLPPSRS